MKNKNKNIVLCSDGTGNKGGYGADTNVYKTYKAVDVTSAAVHQFTFYDQGVGTDKSDTSKNKYTTALSGALGLGFRTNVLHLYHFLARCYNPGDTIFLFGFSRGAATVRAFAGFVNACGLVDRRHPDVNTNGEFDSLKFKKKVDEAFELYYNKDSKGRQAFKGKYAVHDEVSAPNGDLKIKFIGVWDTVSALGFSKDFSWFVSLPLVCLDKVLDHMPCFSIPILNWKFYLAHHFYDYELNNSIENAYHALSIDDERRTFEPKVWNEQGFGNYVEQVWFAGVHSNVGGGYPRTGMSDVALQWMWAKAAKHGLTLYSEHVEEVRESANVYDKIYDSRDGVAIYYRYGPRNLDALCAGKLKGEIAIHYSAYRKIKELSEAYAPDGLPDKFDVVDVDRDDPSKPKLIRSVNLTLDANEWEGWAKLDEKAKRVINYRKCLYRVFVELTMIIILVAGYCWQNPPELVIDLNACEIRHVQVMQIEEQSNGACRSDGLTVNSFMTYQQARHTLGEPNEFKNCVTVVEPEFCKIAGDRPLKWLGDILRY
ncbi:MAG: DUF2235 domain-containing protein, partial [Gammaproteobacteria bacterium]